MILTKMQVQLMDMTIDAKHVKLNITGNSEKIIVIMLMSILGIVELQIYNTKLLIICILD